MGAEPTTDGRHVAFASTPKPSSRSGAGREARPVFVRTPDAGVVAPWRRRARLDASAHRARGATNATFTYDPYGTLAARTGTQTTPLGFAGQYTDAESGLQYLRARYYDPATGQFLTRDPLTAASGQPYGYAGGNPLAATDPSGLFLIDLADVGMFMSDAAAGALNELTFGLSNRIAGVDGSCAGSGYFWGRGLGFAGSFFTGVMRPESSST